MMTALHAFVHNVELQPLTFQEIQIYANKRDITGSLARALVQVIERNKDANFLNLLSAPYWLEYLPLLGFQRIPWAD